MAGVFTADLGGGGASPGGFTPYTSGTVGALGSLIDSAGGALSSYARSQKDRGPTQREQNNEVLKPLVSKLYELQVGLEQGSVKPREYLVKSNVAFGEWALNNPGWVEDGANVFQQMRGLEPSDTGVQGQVKQIEKALVEYQKTPEGQLQLNAAHSKFGGDIGKISEFMYNSLMEKNSEMAALDSRLQKIASMEAGVKEDSLIADSQMRSASPYLQNVSLMLHEQMADIVTTIQETDNAVDAYNGIQLIDHVLGIMDNELLQVDAKYGWSTSNPEAFERLKTSSKESLTTLRTILTKVVGGDTMPALTEALRSKDGAVLAQVIRTAKYIPTNFDADVVDMFTKAFANRDININHTSEDQQKLWTELMKGSLYDEFANVRSTTTKIANMIDDALTNPTSMADFMNAGLAILDEANVRDMASESIRNNIANVTETTKQLIKAADDEGFVVGKPESDKLFSESNFELMVKADKAANLGDSASAAFLGNMTETFTIAEEGQKNAVLRRLNESQDAVTFSFSDRNVLTPKFSKEAKDTLAALGLPPTSEGLMKFREVDPGQRRGDGTVPLDPRTVAHLRRVATNLGNKDVRGWIAGVTKAGEFKRRFDNATRPKEQDPVPEVINRPAGSTSGVINSNSENPAMIDIIGDFEAELGGSYEKLPEEVKGDEDFLNEVLSLADELKVDPEKILAIMNFETGGSFDPAQPHLGGGSARGLIQFMPKTAEGLGTSTAELEKMTRAEQMEYVKKYFGQWKSKLSKSEGTIEDLYMAVLWPKAIDKPNDHVLWSKGSKQYEANKGLDRGGKGYVTKADAAAKVVEFWNKA